MKRIKIFLESVLVVVVLISLVLSSSAIVINNKEEQIINPIWVGENQSHFKILQKNEKLINDISLSEINNSDDRYDGYLRIYIVEPKSRWDNYDRESYHFGFLDFAYNDAITIPYLDTYSDTIIWNGTHEGYKNIKEDNLIVIAAVSNSIINKGYADPPFGNQFDANYIDAAAGAKPGNIGYNTINEDFTHTIFVEEGTATWCPYCPAMAEALNNVYNSGDYPFYFVALVADKNDDAKDRLQNDYNIAGYPTSFFDGGKKVLVGGYEDESYYQTRIEQCGERDVHELNLSVNVEWMNNGEIEIIINIKNNESSAPLIPTIEGPTSGKINKEHDFTVTTTAPDGSDVWYFLDWGDGSDSGWLGPFPSGTSVTESHTWTTEEELTIRAKAKNEVDSESDWATLPFVVPKSKTINITFLQFLKNQQHIFPILRQLLQL